MLLLHWSQMRPFLKVPLLDINSTYQMFAHHGFVIPFKKNAMFPYSEQVQNSTIRVLEMIWMLNELIQAIKMVFMNFWTLRCKFWR